MAGLRRETLGWLLGALGVAIFAATLPMTRIAVAEMSAAFVTAARAAIAGLIAIPALAAARNRPPWRKFPLLALAALCLVFGFPGFTSFALRTLPASHAGIVNGALPLATLVVAAILDKARPSVGFWVCAALGGGVVVAFALHHGGAQLQAGDTLMALAVLAAALGYVVAAQLSRRMRARDVISWMVVLSLPITLALSWLDAPAHPEAVSAKAWASLAYLGVMSMYLGFFAWNSGLAMGGVARVSQVQLAQIFLTLGIAAWLNGEAIDAETLGAAALIVVLIFVGRRLRAGDSPRLTPAPGKA